MKYKNTCSRIRHRLILQQELKTPDSAGGFVRTWQDITDLWAEITPLNGKEKFFSERLQSALTHRVFIRYRSGITTENRLVFNGRALNIRSVMNIDEKNAVLELLVEEGADV